jgi:predicted site-specific integrase-resolvase
MPYRKTDPGTTEWIKLNDAAAVIGCDPRTLRAMIRDGRLKVRAMNFDKTTRIHRGDWQAELARRVEAGISA